MTKNNILYVSAYSEIIGGGQKSFLLMLKHLDKKIFSPIVVVPEKGYISEQLVKINIKTIFLKLENIKSLNFWKIILSIVKLKKIVVENKIKIVHCDDINSGFYIGLLRLFINVKTIFHARVGDSGKLWDLIILLLFDKIICVSNSVSNRFKKFLSTSKIEVVYNSVDLDEIKNSDSVEEEKKLYNIPKDKIIIGFAGQLIKEKGVELLIKSFIKIREKFSNTILFFLGSSKFEPDFKKLVKELNLEKDIFFSGFKENVFPIMKIFDIFVLPSMLKEGLSRAIIEAMAIGKPIVATKIGGNLETVIDNVNGILVNVNDENSLTKGIISLLDDKDKIVKMGQESLKIVKEKFDIKKNIKKIENIYSNLLVR